MSKDKDREEEKSEEFKVSDRRMFTPDGQLRASEQETEETRAADQGTPRQETPPSEDQVREKAQPGSAPIDPGKVQGAAEDAEGGPDKIDFPSFIVSLATNAMVHLGEIADPMTGQANENLEAGRQLIDILGMLKEKTEGNRTSEETQLLDSILYELRMKFMSKKKAYKL